MKVDVETFQKVSENNLDNSLNSFVLTKNLNCVRYSEKKKKKLGPIDQRQVI